MRFGFVVLNELFGIHTDIDYHIYTEAAQHAVDPTSLNPYNRYTYRYTPLLAYIMLPNLVWAPFGKVLFNIFDLAAIYLMKKYMNKLDWLEGKKANTYLNFWIFNVYMIYINGRGSCESISLFLLVLTLYQLKVYITPGRAGGRQRALFIAALAYGMLVHFRLYPILFGFSVVLYINKGRILPTVDLFKFFFYSASLFIGLFVVFRIVYGEVFAYEWALYHLVRKDPRHSQSVFWMRTMYNSGSEGEKAPINTITLVFRIALIILIAFKYKRNIIYAIFLQTMVFTIFNTVYTAQYAIWEIQMFPLMFTQSSLPNNKVRLGILLALWYAFMEASVICGGLYEGQGKNTLYIMHWLNIAYMGFRVLAVAFIMAHAKPRSDF